MMFRQILYFMLALVVFSLVAHAVNIPFTPKGDIDLEDHEIQNCTTAYIDDLNVTNTVTAPINWTMLQNFPTDCSTGYALTGLDDSVTCTDFNRDGANWMASEDAMGYSVTNLTDVNTTDIDATGTATIATLDPTYIHGGTWTDSQNASDYDLYDLDDTNSSEFYGNGYKMTNDCDEVICRTTDTGCTVVCTDGDCSDEFDEAIDRIRTIGSGGVLCVESGIFPLTTSINATYINGLTIKGVNKDSTQIQCGTSDGIGFSYSDHFTLRDLTVDCKVNNGRATISGADVTNATIENTRLISSNQIFAVYFAGPHGASADDFRDGTADTGNKFIRNEVWGNYAGDVFSWSLQRDSEISGNIFYGRVALYHGENINFGDNKISSHNEGIWVTAPALGINVHDNHLVDILGTAIRATGGEGINETVTIKNNRLAKIQGNGIDIRGNGTYHIDGNNLRHIKTKGIYFYQNYNSILKIENNIIRDINYDNSGGADTAIFFEGEMDGSIVEIRNNYIDTVLLTDCIRSVWSSSSIESNFSITGNTIKNCAGNSLDLRNYTYVEIMNNNLQQSFNFNYGTRIYFDDYRYTTKPECSTINPFFNNRRITYVNGSAEETCVCSNGNWDCSLSKNGGSMDGSIDMNSNSLTEIGALTTTANLDIGAYNATSAGWKLGDDEYSWYGASDDVFVGWDSAGSTYLIDAPAMNITSNVTIGDSTFQSGIIMYRDDLTISCMKCYSDGVCNNTAGLC